ncbi:hypothetical protein, partial [Vibrio anguillarum]|uniref:Rz1-like lysis system protein LysC n=2 Tax=Vibrionaceae TaxID=641 RepID=UPI001BE421CC
CGSTTDLQVVTQTRDVVVLPPAAFLTPCDIPFDSPPLTRDEAVERDLIWKGALEKCGQKPDKVKQWYQNKQVEK